MSRIIRTVLGQSLDQVKFDVRKFRGGRSPGVREHIERIGVSFLTGYHDSLEQPLAVLEQTLEAFDDTYRGFAYEGAGMGLFLLDRLLPWGRRFERFLARRGDDHRYMAFVGAGWAIARLPFGRRRAMAILARLDPLLCWLALDGYGFHQGFFHLAESVEGPQVVPRGVTGYARRAFDQGLGRSLWFVDGGDVERMPRTIISFDPSRHADLWSGLGLGATYAGGVHEESLIEIYRAACAAGHGECFSQGAAFAAEARRRAGNLVPSTESAALSFTGLPAVEAAVITQTTREGLPDDMPGTPAYEVWRRRVQDALVLQRVRGSEAAMADG